MSNPPPEKVEAARALLASLGEDVRTPAPSTVRRRQQRTNRNIAVISRRDRQYREGDRIYGEVAPEQQRQADAGAWPTNPGIRRDLLPLTIAVDGTVRRIYEVREWLPEKKKWTADLGSELSNADLDRDYPDFPYRIGDDCPIKGYRAYRPEIY